MARSLRSQYLTFALGLGALLCALIGTLLLYDHRIDSRQINAATYSAVQQKLGGDLEHRAHELSEQAEPQLAAALGDLAAVVDVIHRTGGWMAPDDQAALRSASARLAAMPRKNASDAATGTPGAFSGKSEGSR